jgi:hypothetical protein
MININLDWLTNPLTFYSTLLVGGIASTQLIISMKAELRRRQRSQEDQTTSLQAAVEALRAKIEEMAVESATPSPAGAAGANSVNMKQRAAALRMYGRGSDAHTVSAALKLPPAETELLQKVHRILRADA